MEIEIKKLNNAEFNKALTEFQNNVQSSTMPSIIRVNPDDLGGYIDRHNGKIKNQYNNYIPKITDWGKLKFHFSLYGVRIIPDETVSKNSIIFEK